MVCLFCKATYHKSKNCDKYKTEKARKKRPNSDRFCFSCFIESDAVHGEGKCESNENCTAWYSTYHHKLFCKERIKALAPLLCLPKIDQDLLPRFFKHFDIDEKHLMLVSSPSDKINYNHIKVMYSFDERKIMKCSKSDLVFIVHDLDIYKSGPAPRKRLLDFIKTKTIVFPSKIGILDSSVPADIVLQLLSSNTKSFHMSECPSKLSFSDIIKNAPNLEKIDIYDWDTNITYEDTWIKDLIKYNNSKNFESLHIRLDKVDFNVEDLVEFIKQKCCKSAYIHICFTQDLLDDDEDGDIFDNLLNRVEEHFDSERYDDDDGTLWIGYDGVDGYETFSLGNIKGPVKAAVTPPPQQQVSKVKESEKPQAPSKRVMPSRAATKRNYV